MGGGVFTHSAAGRYGPGLSPRVIGKAARVAVAAAIYARADASRLAVGVQGLLKRNEKKSIKFPAAKRTVAVCG